MSAPFLLLPDGLAKLVREDPQLVPYTGTNSNQGAKDARNRR